MNRVRSMLLLSLVAAACSGGSEKPGAVLHGPGALAVFDGIVNHESGTFRKYLAVANERGDELRLVDLTDNEVVESPGLVFPLSIPVEGRPMWVASADLCDSATSTEVAADGCSSGLPDALVVVASGSNVIEVVDTWSGHPTVHDFEPPLPTLPADAQVLSVASVRVPARASGVAPPEGEAVRTNVGRILIGLTGGRVAVLDFVRDPLDPSGRAIAAPTLTVLSSLGFDPVSLSQGADPRYVYSASRTEVSTGVKGVAELNLPTAPAGATDYFLRALDALVPTEAVAALRFGAVDRVVAVAAAGACGGPPKAVRCGLLAVDPAGASVPGRGNLAANVVAGEGPCLMPLPVPGIVADILAVGRSGETLSIASGSGTTTTSGLAVVSSTDGAIYLVDVQRWTMISEADPVAGTGMTRVSAVSTVAGTDAAATDGSLGLWGLGGQSLVPALSAEVGDLAARIRLTPGFTPDDDWTLAWQGILPGLEARRATLGVAGTTRTLTIPIAAVDPVAFADLAALGVIDGDRVVIDPVSPHCTTATTLVVSGTPAGSEVTLVPAPPETWDTVALCIEDVPDATGVVATFRSGGLVLTGAAQGLAARPSEFVPTEFVIGADLAPTSTPTAYELATKESKLAGDRRFYVTDPCLAGSDCAATWKAAPYVVVKDETAPVGGDVLNALDFPFPAGPALGFVVGFVDTNPATCPPPKTPADCALTAPEPATGTAIHFTTRSGLVPSPRRPRISGAVVASALPSGLSILDNGAAGVTVHASYAAGMVMIFDPASSITTMSVVR